MFGRRAGSNKVKELFLLALNACRQYYWNIDYYYVKTYAKFESFHGRMKQYPQDLVWSDRFCVLFLKVFKDKYAFFPEEYKKKYLH
jgi:hypothetical protein